MEEINPPGEWKAAAEGVMKALAKRLPGIAEALGAYEAFENRQREKALEEILNSLAQRLERVDSKEQEAWLESEDGRTFAGKVLDAALDLHMADNRPPCVRGVWPWATSSTVTNVYRATRDLFLAQRFARYASPLTTVSTPTPLMRSWPRG